MGGRAAEEIVFGEVTTGASNDLEKVTATAKQMVMRFGMSEKLGPRVFGHDHGQPFLGREFSAEPDYSDEIAREIDDEIRRIVESAHVQAKELLTTYKSSLEKLSEILIKRETIEREQFEALLDGGDRGRGLRRRGAAAARGAAPAGAGGARAGSREPAAAAAAGSRRRNRRVGRSGSAGLLSAGAVQAARKAAGWVSCAVARPSFDLRLGTEPVQCTGTSRQPARGRA